MKRKYAAMILGMALAVSSVSVYAEEAETTVNEVTAALESLAEDTEFIVGQVSSVEEDAITVEVMEMAEPQEKPEGEEQATADENAGAEEMPAEENAGEKPEEDPGKGQGKGGMSMSRMELTGEEQTISITEDTLIGYSDGMGNMEKPEGEKTEGEKPEGEKPEGEALDGENMEATDETMEAPDADLPEEDGFGGEKQEMNAQWVMNLEAEEITLEEIEEGDQVWIALDEEGNASVILVIAQEEMPEGEMPQEDMVLEETVSESVSEEADTEA